VHNLVDVSTHLATLRDWKGSGRIRYLGVTHYHAGAHADLEKVIARGDVDFVQVNYSLVEPEAERRLLRMAADTRTAVIVNRPFAEGALFRRTKGQPLPDWARHRWQRAQSRWVDPRQPAVTCHPRDPQSGHAANIWPRPPSRPGAGK
jgi:aryl-alcohol dehydrogenase-like predicted oxidoreductase